MTNKDEAIEMLARYVASEYFMDVNRYKKALRPLAIEVAKNKCYRLKKKLESMGITLTDDFDAHIEWHIRRLT
jgi:hypothetical protein